MRRHISLRFNAILLGMLFASPAFSISETTAQHLLTQLDRCISNHSKQQPVDWASSKSCNHFLSNWRQENTNRSLPRITSDNRIEDVRNVQQILKSYINRPAPPLPLETTHLNELLSGLYVPQHSQQQSKGWFEELWEKIRQWFEQDQENTDPDELNWLIDILEWFNWGEKVWTNIFYAILALVVLGAIAFIIVELRANDAFASLRVKKIRQSIHMPHLGEVEIIRSWDRIKTLPEDQQVLQCWILLLDHLQTNLKLSSSPALTYGQLKAQVKQQYPTFSDAFSELTQAAEQVLYGEKAVSSTRCVELTRLTQNTLGRRAV